MKNASRSLRAGSHGPAVLISIQSHREWQVFCQKILRPPQRAIDPKYADNADRVERREDFQTIIDDGSSSHDREALTVVINENGIACRQLRSVAELSGQQFLRNVDLQPGDMHNAMAELPRQTDQPRRRHVPQLGEPRSRYAQNLHRL